MRDTEGTFRLKNDARATILVALAVSILALTFGVVPGFGQAFTANATGLVTDTTGAVVPGATVVITNAATNEKRTTTTGSEGRYNFGQLLPGSYELTAEAAGFKRLLQRGVILQANRSVEVNLELEVGTITERVEVSEAAPLLDTQTADQSMAVERRIVESLPINMRTPFHLVWVNAGVSMPFEHSSATQDQNYDRFGLNGGRTESTLILIDGVSAATGVQWNGLFYSPTVDSVQEMQVVRNSYDAEFGKSGGGVVSLVTKGGSEQFHGTAFDFLRNSMLDATAWATNRAGGKKPFFARNQFGGSLSGPIWKSKRLFFFGSYEGLRQGSPSSRTTTVPSALERQGDFSQTRNPDGSLSLIFDPFTNRPNPNGAGYIRDAFPNNTIPQSRFDRVGAKVVALYPQPNRAGDPFTQTRNWFGSGKSITTTDRYDIRVDWARSEKHTMYLRWGQSPRQSTYDATYWGVGETGTYNPNPRHHGTFGNTFTPTPTWVINVLLGHGYWNEQRFPYVRGSATTLGFSDALVNLFQDPNLLPTFSPSGYSGLNYNQYLFHPERTETAQVNNTKQVGAHSLKFGFVFESAFMNGPGGGGWVSVPSFSFGRGMTSGPIAATTSSTSGNGLASLLLGTGSGSNAWNDSEAQNQTYYGLYFQDGWRVSSRLTLNYGLRWEVQKPPTDRFDRYSYFAMAADSPLAGQTGMNLKGGLVFVDKNNRHSWDINWRNLAPRIGFAYKASDRLSVRGGYGIFYPPMLGGGNLAGFSATTTWVSTVGGDGINPQDPLSNPFPQGFLPLPAKSAGLLTNAGSGITGYIRQNPNGYIQNYSLDTQFEVSRNMLLEVGYAGNQARKLAFGYGIQYNQLRPEFLKLGPELDRLVPNPFYGKIAQGVLAGPTVPYQRLLREFPQFTGVGLPGSTSGASASYNALVMKLTKRFSQGLALLASYQFSKTIDNASEMQAWEVNDGGPADAKNISLERSISAHDMPHAFVLTMVYDLPVGKGKAVGANMHPVLDGIVGGWQVSGMARYQSGYPIILRAQNTLGNYGYDHLQPNILPNADAIKIDNPTPERWFNINAFVQPAPYTLGTASRRLTTLRQDSVHAADMAVMKSFTPREPFRVQFRAEFFNITNTPQFSAPNTTLGSNTFGQISGTWNSPRQIQLGLRLNF